VNHSGRCRADRRGRIPVARAGCRHDAMLERRMQLQQNPIFRAPSRRRRLGPLATLAFFVALAVVLAGCSGQPAPTATPAAQGDSRDSVEPSPGNYNWTELDTLTAAAERHNVKLLIVFLRAPAWADPKGGIPKDDKNKQAYATMLANAAKRYPGKIAAYEIWNEQNLASETGGK